MTIGSCKLTGVRGKFVKSHLLPKAITRPAQRGNFFIQGGPAQSPIKRFSSWYDEALVIQKGEAILRDCDTAGILELRRLKLIWSSWDGADAYAGNDLTLFSEALMPGQGIRAIVGADSVALRLFFLSLLWRAAATDRDEFSQVRLPADDIEILRDLVLKGLPGAQDFYPVTLVQMTTRGVTHNFAPLAVDETSDLGDGRIFRRYIFRFYFDGLIACFHRPIDGVEIPKYGRLIVGNEPTLAVQTIRAEGSFQVANLLKAREEAYLQWPNTMQRLRDGVGLDYESRLARYDAAFGPGHPWLRRSEP
jgi:hypothetical protein